MDARAQAIERLYEARYTSFRYAAAALVGADQAHDAVQEGFAQALARRDRYRGEGPLEAWVWRIVLRKALDLRRGPRLEGPIEESFDPGLIQSQRTRSSSPQSALSPRGGA